MEVKTQTVDKSVNKADSKVEVGFSSWWSPSTCKITGSVSTKSEHTRSTDKSAKYDIKVNARDDGIPEGLSRVLDMLSTNINSNNGKIIQAKKEEQKDN